MQDMILILNYSDEFSMEIARRLRAEQIHARIAAPETTAQQVKALSPRGVILSGEAAGKEAALDEELLHLGIPVLAFGIPAVLSCYFDIFSGFVQAYVFMLLTMVYIGNSCPPPETQEAVQS